MGSCNRLLVRCCAGGSSVRIEASLPDRLLFSLSGSFIHEELTNGAERVGEPSPITGYHAAPSVHKHHNAIRSLSISIGHLTHEAWHGARVSHLIVRPQLPSPSPSVEPHSDPIGAGDGDIASVHLGNALLGDDLDTRGNIRTPSVLIEQMTLAGD